MAICARCGSTENGRFCANCGSAVGAPGSAEVPPPTVQESTLAGSEPPDATVNLQKGPPPAALTASEANPYGPGGSYNPPGPVPPQQAPPTQNYPVMEALQPGPPPARGSAGRRRGWLIAASVFVVVAALATTAVLVLQRSGDSAGLPAVVTTAAPQSAGPPETIDLSAPLDPSAPQRRAEPPAIGRSATALPADSTAAAAAPATVPATSTAAAGVDLLSLPSAPIPCSAGYIVQIASELDMPTLTAKVAAMSAANTLHAGAKWTDTASSCGIFSSQVNVLVIYAGPFASPYDACAARLTSPPDAFIKGTTPETAKDYHSCLCPAVPDQLPAITTVGQQGVWIGELQRVLGTGLDYDVGSINADPSVGDPGRWGIYTAETAAAVGRFQADSGLAATNQVNSETWSALQFQSC